MTNHSPAPAAPSAPAAPAPAAATARTGDGGERSILFVHAHPDDETIGNGATMAKYAAEGARVTLVTCTLGEDGEILVPELAHLAADRDDALGPYRITELDAAMSELGVADHRLLGGPGRFRDSGMMGATANEHPDCFWHADLDTAAGMLADVIAEVRPQVLVTYNAFGGYGHPDHIQAHRVAMRALDLATARHAVTVAKVYWNTVPRFAVQAGLDAMRADGLETGFKAYADVDEVPFTADDSTATAVIRADDYAGRKTAALRAHATQVTVRGSFYALSNEYGWPVSGTEYYTLVRGQAAPPAPEALEEDLFAGL